jgi:hypothetical protein
MLILEEFLDATHLQNGQRLIEGFYWRSCLCHRLCSEMVETRLYDMTCDGMGWDTAQAAVYMTLASI